MNKQVIPYLRSPRKHFWVGLYKKAGNSSYINVSLHDDIFPWEQFRDPRIAWEPSQVITIAWERWELYLNLSESSRSNEINRERFGNTPGTLGRSGNFGNFPGNVSRRRDSLPL